MTINQSGYDQWSKFYDKYPNPMVAVDDRRFPPMWSRVKGRDVLEIGCGTGRHTVKLVALGNRVTALDLSPGMLEVARGRLVDAPVRFIQSDFLATVDLGAFSFDAALASLVIEHIRDLPAFFGKVASLLRPGGELFVSDIHPDKSAAGGRARFLDPASGLETLLESHPHTDSAVVAAAKGAGMRLEFQLDVSGDAELTAQNASWVKYEAQPLLKIWTFKKAP